MLTEEEKSYWSEILSQLADALDISKNQREEAKNRYEAVGDFLQNDNSFLASYKPEIFPQGSFSIGTIIRPLKEDDEYDIDLVCELKEPPQNLTQNELKEMIGDRLKESSNYRRMLDKEGRKCWTLNYAEGTKFHMDIIPSIPDLHKRKLYENILEEEVWKNALRITDNQHPYYYSDRTELWPKSNPRGYATWFKKQIKDFEQKKHLLAEEMKMEVEEVPDWEVKTPLQRAIQIMKRHRDLMFGDDDKPVSIIITTLAARAYKNEADVYDALMSLLEDMPSFVETGYDSQGRRISVVRNPVDPDENFADEWQEYPQRERNFFSWLDKIKTDFNNLTYKKGIDQIAESLKPSFGENIVNEAIKNFANKERVLRENEKIRMAGGTGMLSSQGRTPVKNHNNFGHE